jgi:hypothetical protein
MREFFNDRLKTETISSKVQIILAESAIGLCFGLATILGIMGAQRSAAPDFPIPENIVSALFIGIAIWSALAGISLSSANQKSIVSGKMRIGLGWILISFATCTILPIIYFLQNNWAILFIKWEELIQTSYLSALSFGVSGALIGITSVMLQFFFWRFLSGLRWGILLTCAISFFLGGSAGWAAYGWTVFSTQALLSLNFPL